MKLIKGGTVVTATETMQADVLIDGEKVVAIASPEHHQWGESAEVVDASGKLVMPGGVDVHTHMELPFGGTFACDNFDTGTRAAAWGGTTTIIDFAVQTYGQEVMPGFEAWMGKAEGNCAVDYGFHMIIGDVTEASLKEMDALIGEGVTSFKLFMAYPGRLLLRRRADLPGDAEGGRHRGHGDDARRERDGHRRAARAGTAAGRDRPEVPRPHPTADHRGGGDFTAPSPSPSWPAARCTSCTWRPRRRWRRWPRPVTAGSTPSPRPVPSTSTSRWRSTCRGPGSRGPSTCARLRSAAGPRDTRTPCGGAWRPTTSRSCRPTTAPSASTTTRHWAPRSSSGWATSPRSPMAYLRWRTGWS